MLKNSLISPKAGAKDNILRNKEAKGKSLHGKRKKSNERGSGKCLENAETKVNLCKKPPVVRKASINFSKEAAGKKLKRLKKKILLQTLTHVQINSDTEKSTKRIDINRAQSNLEHSLKNKLELSQKIISNKNSTPHTVEQIIKSSLKKGKRQRILKEKEIKQKKLEEEIKKIENIHHNNQIRKINKLKCKSKKHSSEINTSRPKQEKVFKLPPCKLKSSKYRSTSSKRPVKDQKPIKSMRSSSVEKEYFAYNSKPNEPEYERVYFNNTGTCRDTLNFKQEESDLEDYIEKRAHRVKVKRNISLIDTEELESFLNDSKKLEKNENSSESLSKHSKLSSQYSNRSSQKSFQHSNHSSQPSSRDSQISDDFQHPARYKEQNGSGQQPLASSPHSSKAAVEEFTRNRAAKVIQKAVIEFLEAKRRDFQERPNPNHKLQNMIKDQLSWREAQLLSLEYLREKELQDLQSLAGVLGENPQLEEFLIKTVNQRYEQFTKVFKENLEYAEQSMIEEMDTLEVMDFSNLINERKEVVSKIIEKNNLTASLSKQDVQTMIKEAKEVTSAGEVISISCQTSEISPKKLKKSKKKPNLETLIHVLEAKAADQEKNSPRALEKKTSDKGLTILTEIKESRIKCVSISEILSLSSSALSPTLQEEDITQSEESKSKDAASSPIPARPSAPLMFLDTDEFNFSLDTMLNSNNVSKKTPQVLPLLNLGSLQATTQNPPLTSDPHIETSSSFIKKFISNIFIQLDFSQLELELKKGLTKNPLHELEKIRLIDLGGIKEPLPTPQILKVALILENIFDEPESLLTTLRFVKKADKIHKKMILEAADEVLQRFRPYGLKGVPMVWSDKLRVLTSPVEIEKVLREVIEELDDYSKFEIGKIATEEMILSNGRLDEELLQDIREDTLGYAIKREIMEFDWKWVDYEFEETQVKIDLSEMILSDLADELIELEP